MTIHLNTQGPSTMTRTRRRRRHTNRWLLWIAAAAVLVLLRALGDPSSSGAVDPATSTSSQRPSVEGTYHGAPIHLAKALRQVHVIPSRPAIPGYDRDCGTGHACSFGQSWSDDVEVEYGHNGCDTRNDLLRTTLTEVQLRPNTNGCVVEAGVLNDPYTGRTIHFLKSDAIAVQIDHLYPLARAWDMGAAEWPLEKRQNFANDPRNLIVADGPANASKGDAGPGEWLPLNAEFRCTYAQRYLEVAQVYDIPITTVDRDSIRILAPTCEAGTR